MISTCIDTLKADLLQILSSHEPSVVVAGHYCLADGMEELSNEGEGEVMSFAFGVELVAEAIQRGLNSNLVLWVNDIGIEVEDRQSLKADYVLPANYQQILDSSGLASDRLIILFESTMRNKASVLLRKLYRRKSNLFERVDSKSKNLVRCVEDSQCDLESHSTTVAYIVKGPNDEKLVVKDGSNPKCNFILATFFQELTKKYQAKLIVNVFNELYVYRLGLGIHVSQKILDNSSSFINVFCDGEHFSWNGNVFVDQNPLTQGFLDPTHDTAILPA